MARSEKARSGHSGWDDLEASVVTDVVSDDADCAEWSGEASTSDQENASGLLFKGAHSAPARERSGAKESPRATEPGVGRSPTS